MFKKIFILVCILFSLSAAAYAQPLEERESSIVSTETALSASVLINIIARIPQDVGWIEIKAMGSGFFVSKDICVTAAHVVKRMDTEVSLKDYGGKQYKAEVIYLDSVKDIAILKVENANHPYFKLADKIELGQSVMGIGNPGDRLKSTDLSFTVLSGHVSRFDTLENVLDSKSDESPIAKKIKRTQMDMIVSSGSSGGPIYNLKGQLVGMIISQLSDIPNITLSTKLDDIRSALSKYI